MGGVKPLLFIFERKHGMRHEKNFIILFCFSLTLLLVSKITMAESITREDSLGKYSFIVDLYNNLTSLENIFSKNHDEISQIGNIADNLIAREVWDLQIPISIAGDGEWGILAHKAGWYWMTGDVARFFQKAEAESPIMYWSYYDLGFKNQRYEQFGLYYQKKYPINELDILIKESLFLAPTYQELHVTGQGRLTTDINDSKKIELNANYRETSARSMGIGISVSCKTLYTWNSGLELSLSLQNLFSLVYFPDVEFENGMVDSEEDAWGPVFLKGFKNSKTCWVKLPLEATAKLSYPLFDGSLILDITNIGLVQNFTVGYRHPVNNRSSLIIKTNPEASDFTLGYSWAKGELSFTFSGLSDCQIRGLACSIFF